MLLRYWVYSAVSVGALGVVIEPRGRDDTAPVQGSQPDASAELRRMRLQIDSLQRRLFAFAQQREADQKDDASDDDRVRALEQRVAGMEKALARRGTDAVGEKLGNTIRAPFTVLDSDGKTLFRVDLTAKGLARAVVGDLASGPHAILGLNQNGGATLAIYGDPDTPLAYLLGGRTTGVVSLKAGTRAAELRVDTEFAKVNLFHGNVPTATLQAGTTGAGLLKISNPDGEIQVQAGIADGVGWVQTSGPGGGGLSTGPGVPSSFIRGWKRPR